MKRQTAALMKRQTSGLTNRPTAWAEKRDKSGFDSDARFSALTPRERDVMAYVAAGKPNKIIAAELGVSQRTIEAHRARVFQKLQVRNAVELTHYLLAARALHCTEPLMNGLPAHQEQLMAGFSCSSSMGSMSA